MFLLYLFHLALVYLVYVSFQIIQINLDFVHFAETRERFCVAIGTPYGVYVSPLRYVIFFILLFTSAITVKIEFYLKIKTEYKEFFLFILSIYCCFSCTYSKIFEHLQKFLHAFIDIVIWVFFLSLLCLLKIFRFLTRR